MNIGASPSGRIGASDTFQLAMTHSLVGTVPLTGSLTGDIFLDMGLISSISSSLDLSGVLSLNSNMVGSLAIVLGQTGVLSLNSNMVGSLAIVLGQTGRLRKAFKKDKTAPIKRLVAAGANQIWYEVL
jgi:hypothetical protein